MVIGDAVQQDDKKSYSLNISPADIIASHNYLEGLNPQQVHAITFTDKYPLLILAGAGTGKTTVLIARMLHLIYQKKIPASKILAMTFTNQAIQEMKNRLACLRGHIPQIQTFHSFSASILRKHGNVVGLPTDFAILDSSDSRTIIKEILKKNKIDEKEWSIYQVTDKIDYWQNHGWNPENIPESSLSADEIIPKEIYIHYVAHLQKTESCDFGGLILKAIEALHHPHILKYYHQKLPYIMVDEYQDINTAQYLLLRLLCQKEDKQHNASICCVGDEDQCIYEWRGAQFSHIINFQKDFKEASIIKLEQNYRSTSHILNTANKLIAHNKQRFNKNLFTKRHGPDDSKVTIHVSQNDTSELSTIITEIRKIQNTGMSLNNMAILVRTAWQTRKFEDAFIEEKIPYKVIGGSFYDRQEIRDSLAYFRLICQGNNEQDFKRIINLPKRGIGKESFRKIQAHAAQRQISLLEASEELIKNDEFRPQIRKSLHTFVNEIRRWNSLTNQTNSMSLAQMILEESGYIAMWKNDKSSEKSQERLDNIKELISKIEQYETLPGYILQAPLRESVGSSVINPDYLQIMTLHAAKGLEFDTVFIPGWEQGLLPHQLSLKESDLEGERRLAYMGITRAKNNCHLFYTINRRTHDFTRTERYQPSEVSQFLIEIYDPSHVQEIIHDNIYGSFSNS
ncbi:putative DNA helicase II homolog [Candidatus Liberibacter solanacearum]|uniref:ATP-dependent helicase n=1 Tax=Candidatus Liberibacter solanacearum TaxID=556287 RepID=UPI003870FAC7